MGRSQKKVNNNCKGSEVGMSLVYLESRNSHCVWSTGSQQKSDIRIDFKGTKGPESGGACKNGKNFGLSSKHRSEPLKGFKWGTDTNLLAFVKTSF